jgi:hypothetical protein
LEPFNIEFRLSLKGFLKSLSQRGFNFIGITILGSESSDNGIDYHANWSATQSI